MILMHQEWVLLVLPQHTLKHFFLPYRDKLKYYVSYSADKDMTPEKSLN